MSLLVRVTAVAIAVLTIGVSAAQAETTLGVPTADIQSASASLTLNPRQAVRNAVPVLKAPSDGVITRWRINATAGDEFVIAAASADHCGTYFTVRTITGVMPATVTGMNTIDTYLPVQEGDEIFLQAYIDGATVKTVPGTSWLYDVGGGFGVSPMLYDSIEPAAVAFNADFYPKDAPDPDPKPTPSKPAGSAPGPVVRNAIAGDSDRRGVATATRGQALVLRGANMNLAAGVYFNSVPAKTWWIDGYNQITVVVPDGIPSGPVQVRVAPAGIVNEDTPSTTVFITDDQRTGHLALKAAASRALKAKPQLRGLKGPAGRLASKSLLSSSKASPATASC